MLGTQPTPLNQFLRRVKHLSQLYDFSVHSYHLATEALQARVKAGELDINAQFASRHGFVPQHHVMKVMGQSQEGFPRDLRAVVLGRLVSDYELFLVAQLRVVAERQDLIFREDLPLDWPRRRLHAFHSLEEVRAALVEADCRMLTSGGFDEITKFYVRHLKIQTNPPGTGLDVLREIHARRHLYVHRAGIADASYVRIFGGHTRVGERIPVDDEYLKRALDVFRASAQHIQSECDARYPAVKEQTCLGRAQQLRIGDMMFLVGGTFSDATALARYFELSRCLQNLKATTTIPFGDVLRRASMIGNRAEWSVINTATA